MLKKMKTSKSAAKRFRVTGSGKIVFLGAGHSHHLEKKSMAKKKKYFTLRTLSSSDKKNIKALLPYLK